MTLTWGSSQNGTFTQANTVTGAPPATDRPDSALPPDRQVPVTTQGKDFSHARPHAGALCRARLTDECAAGERLHAHPQKPRQGSPAAEGDPRRLCPLADERNLRLNIP